MILTQSPFLIYKQLTNLTFSVIKLWVYDGIQTTDKPVNPTTTLQIQAYNEKTTSDISEIINDAIGIYFDGFYNSNLLWVDIQIDYYKDDLSNFLGSDTYNLEALSGYTYFEFNEQTPTNLIDEIILMSNRVICVPEGADIIIPILRSEDIDVTYNTVSNGTVFNQTYLESDDTNDRLTFVTIPDTLNCDEYNSRDYIDINGIRIKVKRTLSSENNKITFYNRFGTLQDFHFTGKIKETVKAIRGASYRRSILVGNEYVSSDANTIITSLNQQKSYELNSDYLDEEYTTIFKELLLSQRVWLTLNNGNPLPVTIENSNEELKTRLNDKLIRYSLKVKMSSKEIFC